jgi:hypothetical protein
VGAVVEDHHQCGLPGLLLATDHQVTVSGCCPPVDPAEVVARPVLEFCRDPHRAPDLLDADLVDAMARLARVGEAAEIELARPFRRGAYRKVAVAARMADDHGVWFTVRHFGRSLWTSVTTRWERTFG